MRLNNLWTPLVLAALSVAACAEIPQPLVFVSENNLGVDISGSPTDSQVVHLNLGYKNRDASFVPVTSVDKAGATLAIRGCYRVRRGDLGTDNLECETAGGTTPQTQRVGVMVESVDFNAADPRSRLIPINEIQGSGFLTQVPAAQNVPQRPEPRRETATTNAILDPEASDGKALPVEAYKARQSMADSLSVFSSFDVDTKAGTQSEIGLGKVFATGIAAQQLTEGQNVYLQYKGRALRYAVADCLNALAKAMGDGKVTAKEVALCAPPASAGK
jgi:hypothetical protein